MYECDFEAMMKIYIVELFNSISNALFSSILNHTYCGKNNVSVYVVQESDTIDVHGIKT